MSDDPGTTSQPEAVIAVTVPIAEAKGGETILEKKQRSDPTLKKRIDYLTLGVLPEEDTEAREL